MSATSEVTFSVPGMSCTHCEKAIKAALGRLNGVDNVKVDLAAKSIRVAYNGDVISPDALAKALDLAGYPAAQGL